MPIKPAPERRGPGQSPPGQEGMPLVLMIAIIVIGMIAFVVIVGMSLEMAEPAEVPPPPTYRLPGDLVWNAVGCAYLNGPSGATPLVVPNHETPDPTDGKLLCDPTKARK